MWNCLSRHGKQAFFLTVYHPTFSSVLVFLWTRFTESFKAQVWFQYWRTQVTRSALKAQMCSWFGSFIEDASVGDLPVITHLTSQKSLRLSLSFLPQLFPACSSWHLKGHSHHCMAWGMGIRTLVMLNTILEGYSSLPYEGNDKHEFWVCLLTLLNEQSSSIHFGNTHAIDKHNKNKCLSIVALIMPVLCCHITA